MKHSEDTHAHGPSHDCACTHDHGHGHSHDHVFLPLSRRWVLSVLIIGALLLLLRSFVVGQMLVRVTSYATSLSYNNVVRICKKIIVIDSGNIQAWTSLGYAYMDSSRVDRAIPVFEKVLLLNPQDKGAASFELGKAYYAKGDFARAIEYFERVRSAGPHASALLEADILKYRHGTSGFRSLSSMQTLLGDLLKCYKHTGDTAKAAEIQQEYDFYKKNHSRVLF